MTQDFQYLPLRHVAKVKNSNVDKLSLPGENPVRLCNYVDVYRNDRITKAVSFMRASATTSEIASFKLRLGDVLITKDSEQWNDIGVPALVATEADDLVCGYHLTMLRPHSSKILGSYLAYALRAPEVAVQLHLAAKGVTRYGLSQQGIKSAQVPVPLLDEQELIVRYLDHAELRIAKAISAKLQVLQLLRERRQSIVQTTVLTGLVPDVNFADSGVDWLGSVPSHWRVVRARECFVERVEKSKEGAEELLSVSQYFGVKPTRQVRKLDAHSLSRAATLVGYKVVLSDDLVVNTMLAWNGSMGTSPVDGIVSPAYAVYRPLRGVDSKYFQYLLTTPLLKGVIRAWSSGIQDSRLRLYPNKFFQIALPLPPYEEQTMISSYLDAQLKGSDEAAAAITAEISLLKEYRTRLISDVVTGKLDVREEAAKLPEIDPMELATVAVGENGDDEEATDDE